MAYQHTSSCESVDVARASLNEKRPLPSQLCRHVRTIELSEKFALAYIALYNSGFIYWRETLTDQLPQNVVPDNDQTRARREHLDALRGLVGNVYPNKFQRS